MNDRVTLQSGYPLRRAWISTHVMYIQARNRLRSPTIACGLVKPCFLLAEKLPEYSIARPAEVACVMPIRLKLCC